MKRLIFCLVVVTVWLIHFTSSPVLAAKERRIALVIGNGAYKSAPLRNPVNDASDIADALGKLGFAVSLKTDANQRSMKRAIRAFGKQLRKGGVGLFYFAGHGVQVRGINYLIPIGAQIESEADVEYEAVDAGRVLAQMDTAGNSLNVIILDACRDNPFARSFRTVNRGLAKMDAPTGSILAYATAPGSIASDGPGRNGLYTSALLKHIMTSGVKIEDVFKQVRIEVVGASGKKQVPWESSSLTGDFYFNAVRGINVVKHPKPESPKLPQGVVDKDMLFWQSIQNSNNPVLFEAYLQKFPSGTFSAIAKIKIEELKPEKKVAPITTEVVKIEKPKEKVLVASISPDVTKPEISARDRHFIKYANGIVHDTQTGLEWVAGPDKNPSWYQAKDWVNGLTIAGGGWRLPKVSELKTLYQKGKGRVHRTPIFNTGTSKVWSVSSVALQRALCYDFESGIRCQGRKVWPYDSAAFAVRTRKKESKAFHEAKEKTVVASISPDATKSEIVARDGRYEKYANGIVKDTKTGLEWYAGPDKYTTSGKAKRWVASLNVGGGGWRMPTINELKGLYQKGVGTRNMTPLLKTSGWWVWSGEPDGYSSELPFNFSLGNYHRNDINVPINSRGFAVRSRKTGSIESIQTQETPKYVSIAPDVSKPEIIAKDGQFVNDRLNGATHDRRNGAISK